jgi:hypothetical protein
MKKILLLIISLLILAALPGCSSRNAHINSEEAVSLYSQLSGFKGIELYVWKDTVTNQLYCGMLEGTNRNKEQSDFDTLYKNPLDIAKAKDILRTYKNDMYVFIGSIGEKLSKDDIKTLKNHFEDLKMKNLTYFIE